MRISRHSMVRFAERVLGYDIKEIKDNIGLVSDYHILKSICKKDGYRFKDFNEMIEKMFRLEKAEKAFGTNMRIHVNGVMGIVKNNTLITILPSNKMRMFK